MKKRISLGIRVLRRLKNGRVQLFNKQFYRLHKGKVIRQLAVFENGVQVFKDWGEPKDVSVILQQIKLLFDPSGEIVAYRKMAGEELLIKKGSIWDNKKLTKHQQQLNELARRSELYLRVEEIEWAEKNRAYCSQKYGRKKMLLRSN